MRVKISIAQGGKILHQHRLGELKFDEDVECLTFIDEQGAHELRRPILKRINTSYFIFSGISPGISGTVGAWIDADWSIEYIEHEEVTAFDQHMWKFAGALS